MSDLLSHLIVPIAIGTVAVVFGLGLWNTMQGGSPQKSQRLMRWRVLLQAIAILIVMVTIWALGR
jgi:Hypoxia induced protein conserved region